MLSAADHCDSISYSKEARSCHVQVHVGSDTNPFGKGDVLMLTSHWDVMS